jgi:hypothetical protein
VPYEGDSGDETDFEPEEDDIEHEDSSLLSVAAKPFRLSHSISARNSLSASLSSRSKRLK